MKRAIIISAVLILVLAAGFMVFGSVFSATGNVISVAEGTLGNQKCVDGDGHLDYRETLYVKSKVIVTDLSGDVVRSVFEDRCSNRFRSQEYVCTDRARVKSTKRFCSNGCFDGACIR